MRDTATIEAEILKQACLYSVCLSLNQLAGGMAGMSQDAADEAQEALDEEQYKLVQLVNELAETNKARLNEILK